jgi:hypothetical protein
VPWEVAGERFCLISSKFTLRQSCAAIQRGGYVCPWAPPKAAGRQDMLSRGIAASHPQRQTLRPLLVLRTAHELSQPVAILSGRPPLEVVPNDDFSPVESALIDDSAVLVLGMGRTRPEHFWLGQRATREHEYPRRDLLGTCCWHATRFLTPRFLWFRQDSLMGAFSVSGPLRVAIARAARIIRFVRSSIGASARQVGP